MQAMLRTVGAMAFALGFGTAANARDLINPIEQFRAVNSFVIVDPCFGADFDDEAAEDFGLFVGEVESSLGCAKSAAAAGASQESSIGSASMSIDGSTSAWAQSFVITNIHSVSSTTYDVTFELTEASEFDLTGTLTASASEEPILFDTVAIVTLFDGDGATLLQHVLTPGPNGQLATLEIDESGALEAGTYRLRVEAGVGIDNKFLDGDFLAGDASFAIDFVVSACAGDVTGDGSVNVLDLLALLGAWGDCDGCPEDVNGDGEVNVLDLLIVLSMWGPCP